MWRRCHGHLRLSSFVFVLAIGTLVGCGGGGGGGGTAPFLFNLVCTPDSATENEGGGWVDVTGRFDFSDPDGDVQSMTLTLLDSSGVVVASEPYYLGAGGITEGYVEGIFTFSTTTADDYTIQIYVTDASGRRSNTLVDIFRITGPPWVALTPMPTPRWRFSTAAVDGFIYVIGGGESALSGTPAPRVATVEVYDPMTDRWDIGVPMRVGVASAMTAVVDGKVYVVGGKTNAELPNEASDAVQVYDPATMNWTQRTPMPEGRYAAAIAVRDGLIYVAAGRGPGAVILDSMLVYDPLADTWSSGVPMSQARNVPGGGATVDGYILVYGGHNELYGGYLATMESYDPLLGVWSDRADGEARNDFGIAVVGGLMYTFGGRNHDAGELDWTRAYDSARDRWESKTPMPVALRNVRSEIVRDRVYVFSTDDTLEYTPSYDGM